MNNALFIDSIDGFDFYPLRPSVIRFYRRNYGFKSEIIHLLEPYKKELKKMLKRFIPKSAGIMVYLPKNADIFIKNKH